LGALGMTPEQYRQKWNLPSDYPMVASNYATQRSAMAKNLGFGLREKPVAAVSASAAAIEVVATEPVSVDTIEVATVEPASVATRKAKEGQEQGGRGPAGCDSEKQARSGSSAQGDGITDLGEAAVDRLEPIRAGSVLPPDFESRREIVRARDRKTESA
jgi:hypothetical protein